MAAAIKYRAITGLTLPDGTRVEPDEVTTAIPKPSVGWLIEQGHIVVVKDGE